MEIRDIVRLGGGPVKVAGEIGLRHSTVIGWKRVPARYVTALHRLSGVPMQTILDATGATAGTHRADGKAA